MVENRNYHNGTMLHIFGLKKQFSLINLPMAEVDQTNNKLTISICSR